MKRALLAVLFFCAIAGCSPNANRPSSNGNTVQNTATPSKLEPPPKTSSSTVKTLADARRGFPSKLTSSEFESAPAEVPPGEVFNLVNYESGVGKLVAYLTPDPRDGKKHPAIVWVTGGDCNSIGDVWSDASEDNDQTARAFRDAGLVMLFPSLRGGNDNPGKRELFFGELDDVMAAADFVSKLAYVDPKRIYLGGHSTGGTLVLLAAEYTDRFRAVFSFGPVENVTDYGAPYWPHKNANKTEIELRSPQNWLAGVKCQTFVFEGSTEGNTSSLRALAKICTNSSVQFFEVRGATHFTVLAPVNALIARKLVDDSGPVCNVAFTKKELETLFK